MDNVIGTCSICGGNVVVPAIWMGVVPPQPTCQSCGAVAARPALPVIPMQPPRRQARQAEPSPSPSPLTADPPIRFDWRSTVTPELDGTPLGISLRIREHADPWRWT